MVINVRVVPRASRNLVKQESENSFKVYLTKPAIEGQANEELVKRLAEYFSVKKHTVNIIKGEKARCKLVRISE